MHFNQWQVSVVGVSLHHCAAFLSACSRFTSNFQQLHWTFSISPVFSMGKSIDLLWRQHKRLINFSGVFGVITLIWASFGQVCCLFRTSHLLKPDISWKFYLMSKKFSVCQVQLSVSVKKETKPKPFDFFLVQKQQVPFFLLFFKRTPTPYLLLVFKSFT